MCWRVMAWAGTCWPSLGHIGLGWPKAWVASGSISNSRSDNSFCGSGRCVGVGGRLYFLHMAPVSHIYLAIPVNTETRHRNIDRQHAKLTAGELRDRLAALHKVLDGFRQVSWCFRTYYIHVYVGFMLRRTLHRLVSVIRPFRQARSLVHFLWAAVRAGSSRAGGSLGESADGCVGKVVVWSPLHGAACFITHGIIRFFASDPRVGHNWTVAKIEGLSPP